MTFLWGLQSSCAADVLQPLVTTKCNWDDPGLYSWMMRTNHQKSGNVGWIWAFSMVCGRLNPPKYIITPNQSQTHSHFDGSFPEPSVVIMKNYSGLKRWFFLESLLLVILCSCIPCSVSLLFHLTYRFIDSRLKNCTFNLQLEIEILCSDVFLN